MKIGLVLPYFAHDFDRDRILTWAREIDRGPFDTLSSGERLIGSTYEMHSMVSAAAAVTERVRINPALYVLPMRQTVMTAKQIATLDVISGGRLSVTVGIGGWPQDYAAQGMPIERRYGTLDKQVATMRQLWRGEVLDEAGHPVGPPPPQGDQLPIYAGYTGSQGIARAARWAHGIYGPSMIGDLETHKKTFDLAKSAWAEAGRTDKPYLIGAFWYSLAPDSRRALHDYVFHYMRPIGDDAARGLAETMTRHSAEAIAEGIRNVRDAGGDECILVPSTTHYDEIEKLAKIIDDLKL